MSKNPCLLNGLLMLLSGALAAQDAEKAAAFSAPTFISEQNVWIGEDNRLQILLPDPNSDGFDAEGKSSYQYRVSILNGCDLYYTTTVRRSSWPTLWKNFFAIPFDDYRLSISREQALGKQAPPSSQGTVLLGPRGGNVGLPKAPSEWKRWLLHVPRLGGGFEGTITFHNRFPDQPATLYCQGYDSSGKPVPGSQKSLVVIGRNPTLVVYQASAKAALFEASITDQVSHLAWLEPSGRRLVDVSISYRSTMDDALSASVAETDLNKGLQSGLVFNLEARKSGNYWDGIAVLNLSSNQSTQVQARLLRLGSEEEIASLDLGSLEPGGKMLRVLSDAFPVTPDTFYTIEASPAQVQVLGLRGSLEASPPLLVGSQVFKSK